MKTRKKLENEGDDLVVEAHLQLRLAHIFNTPSRFDKKEDAPEPNCPTDPAANFTQSNTTTSAPTLLASSFTVSSTT